MNKGKCIICGAEFTYEKGKKLTCSPECQKERNRRRCKERNRLNDQNKRQRQKRKGQHNLVNDALAARQIGISYGQYMIKKQRGA